MALAVVRIGFLQFRGFSNSDMWGSSSRFYIYIYILSLFPFISIEIKRKTMGLKPY